MARRIRPALSKVYWLTHESNAAARLLYDQVAQFGGFIRYTRS